MNCRVCDTPVSRTSILGLCRKCSPAHRKNFEPLPREHENCIDCGKNLCHANRVGRCKSCVSPWLQTLPDFHEKHMAGIWRKFETDPDYCERVRKRARRLGQVTALDPEITAKRRANGLLMYATKLSTPEARAKNNASKKASGWKHREMRIGWCPEEYRPRYFYLTKSRHMKAVDARAIIEREIAEKEALKHVGNALEYLRHYAPVQVLENGYRYGNAILGPVEVIERAKLRGWQPERWAA